MTTTPPEDSNMLEIEANGDITDGVVTVEVKLGETALRARYENVDEAYGALDTLYNAFPQALSTVLEQLVLAQSQGGDHQLTEETPGA